MANHDDLNRYLRESIARCTCFNIRRVSRAVTQYYDIKLKPCGLRITQVALLTAIQVNQHLNISTLSKIMATDKSTLTRNLRPMIDLGYIESLPGSDRRTRELRITNAGVKIIKQAIPLWESAQTSMEKELGKKDMNILYGLLGNVFQVTRH